jgi:hypothetical protein
MFHLIVLPSLNELQLVVCQWASDGPIRNRLDFIISKAIESIDYFLAPLTLMASAARNMALKSTQVIKILQTWGVLIGTSYKFQSRDGQQLRL